MPVVKILLALAEREIVASGQLEHVRQIEHAVRLLGPAIVLVLRRACADTRSDDAGNPWLGGIRVGQQLRPCIARQQRSSRRRIAWSL